jgi:hypothetical protein
LALAGLLGGVAFADDECYDECDNCSADPVFVQQDRRAPSMIRALREARAKGHAVVVLADGRVTIVANPAQAAPVTASRD